MKHYVIYESSPACESNAHKKIVELNDPSSEWLQHISILNLYAFFFFLLWFSFFHPLSQRLYHLPSELKAFNGPKERTFPRKKTRVNIRLTSLLVFLISLRSPGKVLKES